MQMVIAINFERSIVLSKERSAIAQSNEMPLPSPSKASECKNKPNLTRQLEARLGQPGAQAGKEGCGGDVVGSGKATDSLVRRETNSRTRTRTGTGTTQSKETSDPSRSFVSRGPCLGKRKKNTAHMHAQNMNGLFRLGPFLSARVSQLRRPSHVTKIKQILWGHDINPKATQHQQPCAWLLAAPENENHRRFRKRSRPRENPIAAPTDRGQPPAGRWCAPRGSGRRWIRPGWRTAECRSSIPGPGTR